MPFPSFDRGRVGTALVTLSPKVSIVPTASNYQSTIYTHSCTDAQLPQNPFLGQRPSSHHLFLAFSPKALIAKIRAIGPIAPCKHACKIARMHIMMIVMMLRSGIARQDLFQPPWYLIPRVNIDGLPITKQLPHHKSIQMGGEHKWASKRRQGLQQNL